MGFFGKLKENFTHDDIKVGLQSPASVSEQDASFITTVTVQNTGQMPQTISGVKVELVEDRQQSGSGIQIGGQNRQSGGQTRFIMASAENTETWAIGPGESKALTLSVPLNLGNLAEGALPADSPLQAVVGALGAVEKVADELNTANYMHYVNAIASVQGLTLQPSARERIQLLKPGQLGSAINIQL